MLNLSLIDSDQKILLTKTSKPGFAKVDHVEDDPLVDVHVVHGEVEPKSEKKKTFFFF